MWPVGGGLMFVAAVLFLGIVYKLFYLYILILHSWTRKIDPYEWRVYHFSQEDSFLKEREGVQSSE